jgi:hypothetical protein
MLTPLLVGLLFAVLAGSCCLKCYPKLQFLLYLLLALLYICALVRRDLSNLDFADQEATQSVPSPVESTSPTSPRGRRVFGRPFRTAGNIVLIVSLLVAFMHVTLFTLLWEL